MRFCFFGDLYRALLGKPKGGGDNQIGLLSSDLVDKGHEVYVVDTNQIKAFKTKNGIPVSSYSTPCNIRILSTIKACIQGYKRLLHINADVYFVTVRGWNIIVPFIAAKKLKKTFIIWIAADLDTMGFRQRWKYHYTMNFSFGFRAAMSILKIELIFPYILKKADYVLTQHSKQTKVLKTKNIKAYLFPNIVDWGLSQNISATKTSKYVYVGSLDVRKGFDIFYQVVAELPEIPFEVIGKPRGKEGLKIFDMIKRKMNVKTLGYLNNRETIETIAGSSGLISTSPVEGFPISFIEAWSVGVPVISLNVDPGDVIIKFRLGFFANGDIEAFKDKLKQNDLWGKQGKFNQVCI